MVFQLSEVGQLQVMTKPRCGHSSGQLRGQEREGPWSGAGLGAERQRGLLSAGTFKPPLVGLERNAASMSDARVFTEEGGGVTG